MRSLIEPNHPILSIEAQCEALGLPRSSYYYNPIEESKENLELMKRIEELHYKYPGYGYRKTHAHLRREAFQTNEKKVERLWRILGFRSIFPKPNLSKPAASHKYYPYLLNNMWIDRINKVFSTDITFIPVGKGFVYLATVTEVSNTLSVDFCLRVLEKALEKAIPEYFNTDQGAQFTSNAFLKMLEKHEIKISFDGVGRAIDNIYQERSWWSLKYELIYPGCYETVSEVVEAIDKYYEYFNSERPHEALLYATPYEIHHRISPKYSKGVYTGFKVKKAKR